MYMLFGRLCCNTMLCTKIGCDRSNAPQELSAVVVRRSNHQKHHPQKGHTSSDSVAQENVGENSTEDDVHVSISYS